MNTAREKYPSLDENEITKKAQQAYAKTVKMNRAETIIRCQNYDQLFQDYEKLQRRGTGKPPSQPTGYPQYCLSLDQTHRSARENLVSLETKGFNYIAQQMISANRGRILLDIAEFQNGIEDGREAFTPERCGSPFIDNVVFIRIFPSCYIDESKTT